MVETADARRKRWMAWARAVALGWAVAGCGAHATGDPHAALQIVSPADGTHTNALSIAVQVQSAGLVPEKLVLLLAGKPVATLTQPPWLYTLDASALVDGAYPLQAQGFAGQTNWLSAAVTLTVDRTAPTVRSRTPAPGTSGDLALPAQVVFSEPIDLASAQDGGVGLSVDVSTLTPVLSLSADGATLSIRPPVPVFAPTQLTVQLSAAITDVAGNALVLPASPWSWQAPSVLSFPLSFAASVTHSLSVSPLGDAAFLVGIDDAAPFLSQVLQWSSATDAWVPLPGDATYRTEYADLASAAAGPDDVWTFRWQQDSSVLTQDGGGYHLSHWKDGAWSAVTPPPFIFTFENDEEELYRRSGAIAASATGLFAVSIVENSASSFDAGPLDVAVLQGGSWTVLPRPFGDSAFSVPPGGKNVLRYLGDGSLLAGGTLGAVNRTARWDGTGWTALTPDLTSNAGFRIIAFGTQAYAMASVGGTVDVQLLSGGAWSEQGGPTTAPMSSISSYGAFAAPDGDLTVALNGALPSTQLGTVLLRRTGTTWTPLTSLGCTAPCDVFPDARGRVLVFQYGRGTMLLNEP